MSLSEEQINYLKRLNSLLAQKGKEMYEQCSGIYEIYEKQLIKNGGDLDDFEIEIVIEFSTSAAMLGPKYFYNMSYNKEEDLLTFEADTDWKEEYFPDFGERWCYLLHALFSHTLGINEKTLFKIRRVDFEIHITEQQVVDVLEHERFC